MWLFHFISCSKAKVFSRYTQNEPVPTSLVQIDVKLFFITKFHGDKRTKFHKKLKFPNWKTKRDICVKFSEYLLLPWCNVTKILKRNNLCLDDLARDDQSTHVKKLRSDANLIENLTNWNGTPSIDHNLSWIVNY